MANWVEEFLDMMAAEVGAATNTVAAYRSDLEQFALFCKQPLPNVDEEDVRSYVNWLSQRRYAANSVARKISVLRDFYKFLYSEKVISANPLINLDTPKSEKPLPKFLTVDEVRRLIETAAGKQTFASKRLKVMLELMYACGLRVSELVSLPENCLNFDKKQILVRGKGSKERLIPVASSAIAAVMEYLDFRDKFIRGNRKSMWLFPSRSSKLGHMTRDAFFKDIKDLAIQAGIPRERVSPHVFRHSFATHLLHNGVDLRSVQKLLGHEDIGTTEIYTHIMSEDLLRAVACNHPLSKKFV